MNKKAFLGKSLGKKRKAFLGKSLGKKRKAFLGKSLGKKRKAFLGKSLGKKGGSEIWYLVAMILAVIIIVWVLSWVIPILTKGTKGMGEFAEKKWSELTPAEQKKLPVAEQANKELEEIESKSKDPTLTSSGLQELKRVAENLKKKSGGEYKDHFSEENKKKLNTLIKRTNSKIKFEEEKKATKEKIEAVEVAKLPQQDKEIYPPLKKEYAGIISEYLDKKLYDEAIKELKLLEGKISSSNQKKDKDLFNELGIDVIFSEMDAYSEKIDCDKVKELLAMLRRDYADKKFVKNNRHVISAGYSSLIKCYLQKFRESKDTFDKKDFALQVLLSGDVLRGVYPGDYSLIKPSYEEALFYLAVADCSKHELINWGCHKQSKFLFIREYKQEPFEYVVPIIEIRKNKKLGCYVDFSGWDVECLSCEQILKCSDYKSGDRRRIYSTPWEQTCKDDPCVLGCKFVDGWVWDGCEKE